MVAAMCGRMQMRGPDAAGVWVDPSEALCLGHRRLAIIDLDPRANQPMALTDESHVITYNGEIYNYVGLRQQLIASGADLRTTSDTEVILELYRRYGSTAFAMLRGMFALAIWHPADKTLVLARDPYGIKPLYVSETANGVFFASQVKALTAAGLGQGPDSAGLVGFHLWGSVPEPFTLFEDIRAVPAGSYVTVTNSGMSAPTVFADLNAAWDAPAFEPRQVAAEVRRAVTESMRAHLVADVPVAVLLSGGIDSGAIGGLMAQLGQTVEGITLVFDEFAGTPGDESVGARLVSENYGIHQTVRRVGRAEFLADAPAILDAMDQPTLDGVNTWFAAKAVAERGYKVVLSGIGGDELFCGYDTFRNIPRAMTLGRCLQVAPALKPGVSSVFSLAANLLRRPKLRWIPDYAGDVEDAYLLQRAVLVRQQLDEVLPRDVIEPGLQRLAAAGSPPDRRTSGLAQIAMLESTRYLRNQLLRDADWASMAHSLEMRTPLADWTLLRQLAPYTELFGRGRGKRLLAAAPQKPLPPSIVGHRKTGFGLPMADWLSDRRTTGEVTAPWTRIWAGAVANAFKFPA